MCGYYKYPILIIIIEQPEGMILVRSNLQFFCRMLLIVFQRAQGLDEEDWTSEA